MLVPLMRQTSTFPEAVLDRRRLAVPSITLPESLPITARRDDLLDVIRDNQVVIVAGETGSGKSTQLPKLCLELGRGVDGMIGHTQPRRVAARTIAERIAEEIGTPLGETVGYAVRFTDKVGDTTLVKVMTDGILLAEIQRDRMLRRYDTIIIDEAHERSLNIDFLLGYLAQLLPRRPDLKVIVTSATIDTERFAEHFTGAPIVEVTGRTYPVDVRYRPYGGDNPDDPDDDRDQVQAIIDAVDELADEGDGDVLVFLSGEREIHDTADALRRRETERTRGLPIEVLPLYARLSAAEQHRIFQSHTGRRVVLATNVAETSITVPGVRYVVDTGVARMSRYSARLKVQRLPIEPVSQASANQRAGRCGRVAPGICIRLYGEDDFVDRPEFTEPEILRTNLASVILQMTALGLGDVAAFPFIDPPDSRAIRDGVALLEELGAVEPEQPADRRRLTPLGKRLARLPVDPRLGRMVLEAERHGCVREVLIIAAAVSIQDPRERPADKQQAADEMHRRFRVEGSDFLSYVALWDHLRAQQKELSSSQFRKMCRTEFLNYLRVREWQDLFSQLRQVAGQLGIRPGADAGHPDRVHQALLAGLLSHLGMRDGTTKEFRGARGAKFQIVHGSAAAKKPPKWVMAAELVETNRLWARTVASVQPEWAERLGGHLARYSYDEPWWDEQRGAAVTVERVMLYGLPIVSGRQVLFGRIDPTGAREMFLRHALVEGDWQTHQKVILRNREFVEELRAMEDRVRRRDHLVDDETVFAFYDARVGPDVVSSRHFDQWWKKARHADPDLLTMTHQNLVPDGGAVLDADDFPDTWTYDGIELSVDYTFEPGSPDDGVVVNVPLHAVNQIGPEGFDWQVPGLRGELIEAMVRALPKHLRRLLVPIADTARAAAATLDPDGGLPLRVALAAALREPAGVRIEPSAFELDKVPDHLRITFAVVDGEGQRVAIGKDIEALKRSLGKQVRAAVAQSTPSIERSGITTWDLGVIPEVIESERDGVVVRGYPALLDEGTSVALRVFTTPAIQSRIMHTGVRRLLLLSVPVSRKAINRDVTNAVKLAIGRLGTVTLDEIYDDCIRASADAVLIAQGGAVWDADGFEILCLRARDTMPSLAANAVSTCCSIALEAAVVQAQIDRLTADFLRPVVDDARAHLTRLVRPGFVTAAGVDRLPDVLRYTRGIQRRLERSAVDTRKDQDKAREVGRLERRYTALVAALPPSQVTDDVREIPWMIEELRISHFAQVLGTKGTVSAKRIDKALARFGG
jgi:ATP-dependent helicase HrpA